MHMQFHPVLTVAALFLLGLLSPGPNFFLVTETALLSGRLAGFATSLGAAAGDAVYSSLGLFGISQLIAKRTTMIAVELAGGAYLLWLGVHALSRGSSSAKAVVAKRSRCRSMRSHFWRGFMTDLANPKTVIFFASIFAVTITPHTLNTVRAAMLIAILATSIAWRFTLTLFFSTSVVRNRFERKHHLVERVFGAALCFFGLILLRRAIA